MTETKPQPKTVKPAKNAKARSSKGEAPQPQAETKPQDHQAKAGSPKAAGRSAKLRATARRPKIADAASFAADPSAASKLDRLTALLARPEGASLAEMMALTDWQAHSVRGVLAGALKRRGLTIASEKIDGVRRYRSGAAR